MCMPFDITYIFITHLAYENVSKNMKNTSIGIVMYCCMFTHFKIPSHLQQQKPMLYLLFSISIFHHIIKSVKFLFSLFYFFPFPLEGLASNDGSMSFGSSPLTVNSLSARCCRVPPHFIPLSIRRDFNFSSPKTSISVALLQSSKSNGLSS